MDFSLIKREFCQAKEYFSNVEIYSTADGKVYVKLALQPTSQQIYVISIYFPDTYPNEMPTVYVYKPVIDSAPHRYTKGNICYLYPTMWNPGVHNLLFVIQRAAKWLSKYEIWKRKGIWPGAEIKH